MINCDFSEIVWCSYRCRHRKITSQFQHLTGCDTQRAHQSRVAVREKMNKCISKNVIYWLETTFVSLIIKDDLLLLVYSYKQCIGLFARVLSQCYPSFFRSTLPCLCAYMIAKNAIWSICHSNTIRHSCGGLTMKRVFL